MAIVQDSIKNQLYEEIKSAILHKKYRMGEQLNPKQIAQQYDVSVMPVRDALLQLTRQGLVVNRARVGFYVARYTSSDIGNIMEARQMHELFCLDRYFTQLDLSALQKTLDGMRRTLDTDKEKFDKYDVAFHNIIVSASNNEFLDAQYDRIKDLLTLLVYFDTGRDKEASEEHEVILDAIMQKDKAKALYELDTHLSSVATRIARNMDEGQLA